MPTDKAEKLRALINKSSEEKNPYEEVGQLLSKQKKNEAPKGVVPIENRVARLRTGVAGLPAVRTLDFSKIDFQKYADKNVRALGEFYQASSAFLSRVASFLGSLPVAAELRHSLQCAGMKIDAETYIASVSSLALVASVFTMLFVSSVGITAGALSLDDLLSTALLIVILGIFTFVAVAIGGMAYPSIQAQQRARQVDRELPFALRHLATQMSAGVSFQRALASVAQADYGILSVELRQSISRMESGLSTEDALLELSNRTYSSGLQHALMQIVRALRTGGKISEIISEIAEDVSFETRMRIRDFTERLNLISVVFIMIAVVAPVVVNIFTAILQLPLLGGGISPAFIAFVFLALSAAMFSVILVIKQMEPTS